MADQNSQHDLFRQEWVRWQPHIYAYIRSLVIHRADAEDLLQDVASVLWEKIDQFEEGTRFDQWAYSVARNKVLNFQKKKARSRVVFCDELTELLSGDEWTPSVEERRDLLAKVETCIKKLSETQRKMLGERYQPGATNRSVAQATGISESTVSRNLNKVYRTLLECIESPASEESSPREES